MNDNSFTIKIIELFLFFEETYFFLGNNSKDNSTFVHFSTEKVRAANRYRISDSIEANFLIVESKTA